MDSRRFAYDGTRNGKQSFEVQTNLTDDEAIELLGGINGGTGPTVNQFKSDCAFEIHKLKHGLRVKPQLLAWAFKMAEDARKPRECVKLSAGLLKLVKFRKPVRGVVAGEPYEIKLCGGNSSHAGEYCITDGGAFRQNRFYGYAKKDGTWQPTGKTPACVKEHLTK